MLINYKSLKKLKQNIYLKNIIHYNYSTFSFQNIVTYKKKFLDLKNLQSLINKSEVIQYIKSEYDLDKHFLNTSTLEEFLYTLKNDNNFFSYLIKENSLQTNQIIKENGIDQENLPLIDLLAYYIKKNYHKQILDYKLIKNLVDLNNPHDWYPQARKLKRKIIYHMGPTNSGKTSHALKGIIKAKSGIYCAPLRLLAWEIQEKLISQDVKCSLLTGQEKIEIENATHISCTIEKVDVKNYYDCAIIDEIQMISDEFRGNAWTEALLGLRAEEIHLCGDPRALWLVSEICKKTGDVLVKKTYNRLGILEIEDKPLKDFKEVKSGDCLIGFNKEKLHIYRKSIQKHDMKSAIIYGHLPPATKKEQVKQFNSRELNVMCATDAIGLGLNLNIERIIFTSIEKGVEGQKLKLTHQEIKQIAGRAGRSKNMGYVTAMKESDLSIIRECLSDINSTVNQESDDKEYPIVIDKKVVHTFTLAEKEIKQSRLFPSLDILTEFESVMNKLFKNHNEAPFKYYEIIQLFKSYCDFESLYCFKDLTKYLKIAKSIYNESCDELAVYYHFNNAPIRYSKVTIYYTSLYLKHKIERGIVKIPKEFMITLEDVRIRKNLNFEHLREIEDYYNCLEIYLYLSFRFENNFIEKETAILQKNKIAEIIEYIIDRIHN